MLLSRAWPRGILLRGPCDVARDATALATPKRHMRTGRSRDITRRAFNGSRARRTAQRCTRAIIGDQVQGLRRIVRGWAGLTHTLLLNSKLTRMTTAPVRLER